MSNRPKKLLEQSEPSLQARQLQEKFRGHILERLEKGLSHHNWAFRYGIVAFIWSFGVVYIPLTQFLWANWALFAEPDRFETVLKFLGSQGSGIIFVVLCVFPLTILLGLGRYNRIDSGKDDKSEKLSDYIPTSGVFPNW